MGVTLKDIRGNGIFTLVICHDGRKIRRSLGRIPRAEAEQKRLELEQLLEAGVADPLHSGPTFGEFADRYLRGATGHLAATTREDRNGMLGHGSRLRLRFGDQPLAGISKRDLVAWWTDEIESRELTTKTGRNYLDALSAVFAFAVDLELLEADPVPTFRLVLSRRGRSKQARAEADPARLIRPIEDLAELAAFVAASAAAGGEGHVVDLLQLDAGLRLGEVAGLSWDDIGWGKTVDDPRRALRIRRNLARGRGELDTPKSGRARTVALSRRLRAALRAHWLERGQPLEGLVVRSPDQPNYRQRHFTRVWKSAKYPRRRPKDLRDTFASQLLTAGVALGYLSKQLGHADVAVTARHYARYLEGDGYRQPLEVAPNEVPADLLARLDGKPPPTPRRQRKGNR